MRRLAAGGAAAASVDALATRAGMAPPHDASPRAGTGCLVFPSPRRPMRDAACGAASQPCSTGREDTGRVFI
jgi:hypothetical protein